MRRFAGIEQAEEATPDKATILWVAIWSSATS
jgi:hypothetical protein